MQVYYTVLNVVESFSPQDYMRYIHDWMGASKYNDFGELSWNESQGYELSYVSGDGSDSMQLTRLEDFDLYATRLTTRDTNKNTWYTDVVFDNEAKTFTVWINRELDDVSYSASQFHTPNIIKYLIKDRQFDIDDELYVSSYPYSITEENCQIIERIIRKESNNKLPVVYLTKDIHNNYLANPKKLARELQGSAHVLLEADSSISNILRSTCNQNNAYHGGIGIYYPNPMWRNHIYIPQYIIQDTIIGKIKKAVGYYLNIQKREDLQTWEGIQKRKLQIRQEELFAKYQAAKEKGDKYLSENQELDDLFTSMYEQLEERDKEIDYLQRRNLSQEYELEGIKTKLSNLDDLPVLFYGKETDLYPGEVKNILLDILNDKAKEYQDNERKESRRAHIINDLLESNDFDQAEIERKNRIKEILVGAKNATPKLKQELQDFGFIIDEGGKHYRLTYYGDPRYVSTLAKTGSDGARGGKNMAAEIINKML